MSVPRDPCRTCGHGRAYHVARVGGCIDLLPGTAFTEECGCGRYTAQPALVSVLMDDDEHAEAVAALDRAAAALDTWAGEWRIAGATRHEAAARDHARALRDVHALLTARSAQ